MQISFTWMVLVNASIVFGAMAATPLVIQSPDGKVSVKFTLQAEGAPAYQIDYLGKPVVFESYLGFERPVSYTHLDVYKRQEYYHGQNL